MEKRIETVAEIRIQFRKHAEGVDEEKVLPGGIGYGTVSSCVTPRGWPGLGRCCSFATRLTSSEWFAFDCCML